jgi:phosphatidate cytidylyltransferase
MAKSDLPARVGVALVGIPLALVVIYLGGWPLGLLIAVLAGIAAAELQSLAQATGGRPFNALGIAGAALLVLLATGHPSLHEVSQPVFVLLLGLTLAALAGSVWLRWPDGAPLSAVSTTVTSALFTGGTLSFALLLRHLPTTEGAPPTARDGAALLFFPILVTWVGDSCAYFAGRAWGVRKLIPRVSPGKTVVGGVAGLVGAVIVAVLYGELVLSGAPPRPGVTVVGLGLMGLLLGIAAQVGDLAASVLKREAGVKDSGRLFPGHGGALDRLDALFFTIPLAYALLHLAEVLS